MFLVARDRMDAALSQVQSAVAIDPASLPARAALGMVWHYTGNQRQAERTFLDVLAIDGALLAGAQRPGAHAARRQAVREGAGAPRRLGAGLDRSAGSVLRAPRAASRWPARGSCSEARQIADELLASPKADGEVDAASVLVALGDVTQALTLLEQAVQQRSSRTLFLRHDARFEGCGRTRASCSLLDSMDFKR